MDAQSKSEYDKIYYAKNRDAIMAKRKARREKVGPRSLTEAQKAKAKETNRAWHKANEEVLKAKRRAYYLANKEKIKARTREYAKANPEQTAAYLKAWIEYNPERYQEHRRSRSQLRRARFYGVGYEKFLATEIFKRDNWTCGICNEPIDKTLKWPDLGSVSIDHIIPLSKGGNHTKVNTQAAHLGCNIRKGSHG
jgi:5-methylcytosine-specific restriction endonuclease McrA